MDSINLIMYWLSSSVFVVSLFVLVGVLLHYWYFRKDTKHKLDKKIQRLLLAQLLSTLSIVLYNGGVFIIPPEEYHLSGLWRVFLKAFQLGTILLEAYVLVDLIIYYARNMRIKD